MPISGIWSSLDYHLYSSSLVFQHRACVYFSCTLKGLSLSEISFTPEIPEHSSYVSSFLLSRSLLSCPMGGNHVLQPHFQDLCHAGFIINKCNAQSSRCYIHICADDTSFFFHLCWLKPCSGYLLFVFLSAVFLEIACHPQYVVWDRHQSDGPRSSTTTMNMKKTQAGGLIWRFDVDVGMRQ